MQAPYLLEKEEQELWNNKNKKEAIPKIVESHLRMVLKITMRYKSYNLPLEDLLQEGILGLIKGAQRFKRIYNIRFSSYAHFWIRAFIQNFILQNWSIVRLSQYRKKILFSKFQTNCSKIQTFDQNETIFGYDLSLNANCFEDGNATIQDFIADTTPNPEEEIFTEDSSSQILEWIKDALKDLTQVERSIIKKRYLNEPPESYQEIALFYKVQIQDIRHIEYRALRKLQNYHKKNVLK